jgi:HTH-type transcriptional regulator / antitoxin HigA
VYPRVIKNEGDHERAFHRVDELIDAEPDTPEGDKLELWTILIEAHERPNHSIAAPDLLEAIRFRMDQMRLRPVDLAPYLGGRGQGRQGASAPSSPLICSC